MAASPINRILADYDEINHEIKIIGDITYIIDTTDKASAVAGNLLGENNPGGDITMAYASGIGDELRMTIIASDKWLVRPVFIQ